MRLVRSSDGDRAEQGDLATPLLGPRKVNGEGCSPLPGREGGRHGFADDWRTPIRIGDREGALRTSESNFALDALASRVAVEVHRGVLDYLWIRTRLGQ